uniref:Uncharacterized protein n=1 Tax=Arundo donax TaxID=35708 RepID=A0A0A9AIG3_ARUDO
MNSKKECKVQKKQQNDGKAVLCNFTKETAWQALLVPLE